jgi:hypothetical protein
MRPLACASLLLVVPLALPAQRTPSDTVTLERYATAFAQAIAVPRRPEPPELRAERLNALTPPPGYEALHRDAVRAAQRLAQVTTLWRLAVGDDPVVCGEGLVTPPGGCRPLPTTGTYGARRHEALAQWTGATAAIHHALDRDLARMPAQHGAAAERAAAAQVVRGRQAAALAAVDDEPGGTPTPQHGDHQ